MKTVQSIRTIYLSRINVQKVAVRLPKYCDHQIFIYNSRRMDFHYRDKEKDFKKTSDVETTDLF